MSRTLATNPPPLSQIPTSDNISFLPLPPPLKDNVICVHPLSEQEHCWFSGRAMLQNMQITHCVKNVRIGSFSRPYSVRMRQNADQNNSEYGHFSRSDVSDEMACFGVKNIRGDDIFFIKSDDIAKYLTLENFQVFLHRSRHRRCSVKKDVLRNFAKFTGKHLRQSLFFKKIAALRPATLLKKKLWQSCFPVNFAKFLRTPFLQNTPGRLLLSTIL